MAKQYKKIVKGVVRIYCTYCDSFKLESEFSNTQIKRIDTNKPPKCKECSKAYNKEYNKSHREEQKQYREEHKDEIKEWRENNKDYFVRYEEENKDHIKAYRKQYKQDHKEEIALYNEAYIEANAEWHQSYKRQYREEHKQEMREYQNERDKQLRAIDPSFKLRENISRTIRDRLKKLGSSKNNISCTKYLPYTINELKQHLESLFEQWMNWNNYGIYNSNWNDEDASTWTWNIDHIIPQSKLPYKSMDDDNFKKCWALENLRPYSARQNTLDGNNR
jgi:hypothetical protein